MQLCLHTSHGAAGVAVGSKFDLYTCELLFDQDPTLLEHVKYVVCEYLWASI